MSGPVDVMRHKLVSQRAVSRKALRQALNPDEYRRHVEHFMGAEIGVQIVERYRPKYVDELSDDRYEMLESQLFVFSPEEMAAFVADVRERAIHEILTVADGLTTDEEKPDEQ